MTKKHLLIIGSLFIILVMAVLSMLYLNKKAEMSSLKTAEPITAPVVSGEAEKEIIHGLPDKDGFTEASLLKYINEPDTPVIGWSKNGKIAYLNYVADREPTGNSTIYVVVADLVSNTVIGNEFCRRTDGPVDKTNIKKILRLLSSNKIMHAPTAIQQFPIKYDGETIGITFDEEVIGKFDLETNNEFLGTIQIEKYKVTLKLTKEKSIKTKSIEIYYDGPHYFGDGSGTIHYYRSPYGNLIAIPYTAQELGGLAGSTMFSGENGMVGCDLDTGFN